MGRTIPTALATHIAGEVLTLALCVKVTRKDGAVMGFTSCDVNLSVGGVSYEAASSISASALRQEAGAGVDNLELLGLLSSDRITEADLLAGRYDGAAAELFLVNHKDVAAGQVTLVRGTLGEVRVTDGRYVAQFSSLAQRLQQQIGELTAPGCRARLGDARCGVAAASYQFARTVASVASEHVLHFGSDNKPAGYYDSGQVKLSAGANAGLGREVKRHTVSGGTAVVELQEPFPFPVSVGAAATLEAGCDGLFATCVAKWNNAVNFRGEPHVPGTDKLLQRGRG
jgi:uncharacterized phage protein (TIGR02218 family)